VAKESALRFNPHVSIESHQADIKNKEFNVDWFKQFTMVLNALDNLGRGTKLGSKNETNVFCFRGDRCKEACEWYVLGSRCPFD
jgi:hypothetical protein